MNTPAKAAPSSSGRRARSKAPARRHSHGAASAVIPPSNRAGTKQPKTCHDSPRYTPNGRKQRAYRSSTYSDKTNT